METSITRGKISFPSNKQQAHRERNQEAAMKKREFTPNNENARVYTNPEMTIQHNFRE